jgi:hypothetical protein
MLTCCCHPVVPLQALPADISSLSPPQAEVMLMQAAADALTAPAAVMLTVTALVKAAAVVALLAV